MGHSRSKIGIVAGIAAAVAVVIPGAADANGGGDADHTVQATQEVVEITAVGGRGGNGGSFLFQQGGSGCSVTMSLSVADGDTLVVYLGGNGGDTERASVDADGGSGGPGVYPGGAGGAVGQRSDNAATPGGGGGGATVVRHNAVQIIVAAGGGGATSNTGGGSGCAGYTAAGENGYGVTPVAQGGAGV